jgi:kumamolisin
MENTMTVRKKWGLTITIAGLAALVCFFFAPDHLNPFSRTVALQGHTPSVVNEAELVSHANPGDVQTVVIGLALKNEADLEKLIDEQDDPNSPNYQKYLTTDEFKATYSPDQADVDAVTTWATGAGLTVVDVSDNRTLIEIEGTTEQFEKAFQVKLNRYRLQRAGATGGTTEFTSNNSDPRIPAHLKSVIQSVIGLNTGAQFESHMRLAPSQPVSHLNMLQSRATPYGIGPQDVANVYNFPNDSNRNAAKKYSGAGRKVAIATAYTYNQSDVDDYWKQYGITRTGTIRNIYIKGQATQADTETTLDLQQLGAAAPGADILMYIAKDPAFTKFTKVFNQIVVDNEADVVSVSWGLCEVWTGSRQMKTEHNIFLQAASQGIVIFAAAGDDGAYDCRGMKQVQLAVDYPSSDPYVTAVGGTELFHRNGRRTSEKAWTGTGGGKSSEYKRKAWQVGAGIPAGDERVTSDVSMAADPYTPYSILFEGKWIASGGTSISAPNWAALWIMSTEAAGKRIGSGNARIYRMGNSADYSKLFYDVTQGDNGDGRGPGYSAGTGWDHPTGWGAPNGVNILNWLVTDVTTRKAAPAVVQPGANPGGTVLPSPDGQ